MGGGGMGGTFRSRTPAELVKQVRIAEDETSVAQFEAELSGVLAELLGGYNGRDVELVSQRLEEIKSAMQDGIEGSFDQLYGGSVAKHTYVDGLSDIDSLVLLNGSGLEKESPQAVLSRMRNTLADALQGSAQVTHGKMAVTVNFNDGMSIQLLPSIKTDEGLIRVPSFRRDGWSHIDPTSFTNVLTARNKECANKLIPTIKLAKAIIGELPETHRLSGYHVESLAIAAFRGYDGPKTTAAMLPTFFEQAKDRVMSPVRDSTGQSVHVDDYLGASGSMERVAISHVIGRLAKRMRNATAAGSTAQWRALFGFE